MLEWFVMCVSWFDYLKTSIKCQFDGGRLYLSRIFILHICADKHHWRVFEGKKEVHFNTLNTFIDLHSFRYLFFHLITSDIQLHMLSYVCQLMVVLYLTSALVTPSSICSVLVHIRAISFIYRLLVCFFLNSASINVNMMVVRKKIYESPHNVTPQWWYV